MSIFSPLEDCEVLEIRTSDRFALYSFSRTGTHLELAAHSYLLNEYWLCEHLEGAPYGAFSVMHQAGLGFHQTSFWVYKTDRHFLLLCSCNVYSFIFTCLLKPTDGRPLGEAQKNSSFIECRGWASPFCSWWPQAKRAKMHFRQLEAES